MLGMISQLKALPSVHKKQINNVLKKHCICPPQLLRFVKLSVVSMFKTCMSHVI